MSADLGWIEWAFLTGLTLLFLGVMWDEWFRRPGGGA